MVKVKILGISGTSIKDGNCDAMVRSALEAASVGDVETQNLRLTSKIEILGVIASGAKQSLLEIASSLALLAMTWSCSNINLFSNRYFGDETDFITLADKNIAVCQHCQWRLFSNSTRHSDPEPFVSCHSECSEESHSTQDRLREGGRI